MQLMPAQSVRIMLDVQAGQLVALQRQEHPWGDVLMPHPIWIEVGRCDANTVVAAMMSGTEPVIEALRVLQEEANQ